MIYSQKLLKNKKIDAKIYQFINVLRNDDY